MNSKNMISASGNAIPNQIKITDDSGNRYFQSYNSIICKITREGTVILDEKYWNYSKTTSKYRSIFLNEPTGTTARKITSGEFKLANLN